MATVYLAQDIENERPVALKVLRPELSAATITAERFLREIEIVKRLSHPNILKLIHSGEAAGLLYCVMHYVEGGTMRHLLRRQKQLAFGDAVRFTREIAD